MSELIIEGNALRRAEVNAQAESSIPVAIIGTGNVGGELLNILTDRQPGRLRLLALANSRQMLLDEQGLAFDGLDERLEAAGRPTCLDRLVYHLRHHAARGVIVDLTASPEVAARHAQWLRAGLEVVTANKWAVAAGEEAYQRLRAASEVSAYRHATTVGAGLPLLETIQRLRASGERILSVSGLFSGTLSYLTQALATGRPFSEALSEAQQQGLTEPDPRLDLSGLDVARKLIITARAAGHSIDPKQVAVESLYPETLADWPLADFLDRAGPELDAYWQAHPARKQQGVPRYVATVDGEGRAQVGIRCLPADHPFVAIGPTDNIFQIRTDSYDDTPIIIRGPGAGARVTATQVLADIQQFRVT